MAIFRFESTAGPDDRVILAECELPDLQAARIEAVRYLGELLRDDGAEFWINGGASMAVTDDVGVTLFTLRLSATEGF